MRLGKVFVILGGADLLQGAASHGFGGSKIISDADCYVGAEIPPAGAPPGFDSAAMVGFCGRRCTVVPLRSE